MMNVHAYAMQCNYGAKHLRCYSLDWHKAQANNSQTLDFKSLGLELSLEESYLVHGLNQNCPSVHNLYKIEELWCGLVNVFLPSSNPFAVF
jgi:hypothetical protein